MWGFKLLHWTALLVLFRMSLSSSVVMSNSSRNARSNGSALQDPKPSSTCLVDPCL